MPRETPHRSAPEPAGSPESELEAMRRQVAVLRGQLAAGRGAVAKNARLRQQLDAQKQRLTDALEQQMATAEVLKIISQSAFDLGAVLRTLLEHAVRLCGAGSGLVGRFDGRVCRVASDHGISQAFRDFALCHPVEAGRSSLWGRVILERRVVHVPDVTVDPEYAYGGQQVAGYRSILGVPLLREGLLLGVFGLQRYEPVPFTDREIALVTTFADQAVIAIENARLIAEVQERDERRRLELERAGSIQRRLLPEKIAGWPGHLEFAVRFRPALEASGDFYDVLALPPATKGALEPLQIAVGDVAGKGMAAALVMAQVRSDLRLATRMPGIGGTPSAILRLVSRQLHRDLGSRYFAACALAVVEPPGPHHAGAVLRLANAAQVPVLLVRGGCAKEIEPPGDRLPLGVQDGGAHEDAELELRPLDVVVFSSDGLVEAPALAAAAPPAHLPPPADPGEYFGFERLARSAAHWSTHAPDAEAVARGIWSDLTAWCGDEPHHDDMTLLVLRVTA